MGLARLVFGWLGFQVGVGVRGWWWAWLMGGGWLVVWLGGGLVGGWVMVGRDRVLVARGWRGGVLVWGMGPG